MLWRTLAVGAAVLVWVGTVRADGPAAAPKGPLNVLMVVTTDEHGWLEPYSERGATTYQGGMAHLMGQLNVKEAYRPDDVLLLSAGDMWTGPFENTLLQGKPMLQVMNSMGYDAAAIGNHEFDFGQEVLQRRASESKFPFLSANIYKRGSLVPPPYAKPFSLVRAAGVTFGVVGLTTPETVYTTDARNLGGLHFGDMKEALEREVPRARAAGAQVIVVLAHSPVEEMRPLVPALRALGINMVMCGHRHQGRIDIDAGDPATESDDVVLCNAGPYGRSYCRAQLQLDAATGALRDHAVTIEAVQGVIQKPTYPPVDGIMQVAAEARSQANSRGAEVLGTVPGGLQRRDPIHTMGYFVTDAWRDALPYADFAVSNRGGFRQDIGGPEVSMRDLVGAMPFDNYLLVVKLTYPQLVETVENAQSIPSGLLADVTVDTLGKRTVRQLRDLQGRPLAQDKVYKVVVNDFMYRGGDRYRLKEYDADPEETALHWRDPVVRLLRKLSSGKKPIAPASTSRFNVVP